jgi:hypothetical protein
MRVMLTRCLTKRRRIDPSEPGPSDCVVKTREILPGPREAGDEAGDEAAEAAAVSSEVLGAGVLPNEAARACSCLPCRRPTDPDAVCGAGGR